MKQNKDIMLYKEFLKKYHISSPVNYHLIHLDELVYPPFGDVKMDKILELWKDFLAHRFVSPKGALNFYTHIPYCVGTCHFCCYSREELKEKGELDLYIKNLQKYYRFFKDTFQNVSFTNLYIGGGTPSILSPSLLENLFSKLFSSFRFDEDGQRAIEVSPATISYKKLKIIKEFGFNRVSFGTQSFNEKTLKLNNRANQTNSVVKKAIQGAKNLGFEWINIDLLIGLHGDSAKDIFESFKKAISFEPQSIHLYSLQPTPQYLTKVCKMDMEEYFRHKQELIKLVLKDMCRLAEKKNYIPPDLSEVSLSFTDPNAYVFNQKGLTRRKFYSFDDRYSRPHVFGLGYLSSSHINGKIRYKMKNKLTSDPSCYVFSGTPYDEKREMIVFILRNLSYRKFLPRKEFRENFGKDITEEFGGSISKLKKMKVLSIERDKIQFKVTTLKDRLLYSLFFFDKSHILEAVKRLTSSRNYLVDSKKSTPLNIPDASQKNGFPQSCKLQKKINLLKEKHRRKFLCVINCHLLQKKKKLFLVEPQKLSARKKEILLAEDTLFVEVISRREGNIFIYKKEVSFDALCNSDCLSLVVYKEGKKTKCLVAKKIINY